MENVTKPEHVLFLAGLFCLFCVLAGWWLFSGVSEDSPAADESTGDLMRRAWSEMIHWRPIRKAPFAAAEPEPARSNEFPLPNGQEPHFGVRNLNANAVDLQLNADEVAAVWRMIEHNKTAAKPSKTSTIQTGFGLSRGGGEKYQRASLIYDALFGPPTIGPQFRQDDGTTAPASRPITGRRTAA